MAGLITDTKLKEIADAIRTKKGTTEPIVANDFPTEILSIESVTNGDTSGNTPTVYTGHADVEGLKAIGWTDEDIAYYQKHGVNWMEEYDYVHKVPQSDIDLYVKNGTYNSNVIYLPKIDTSTVTNFSEKFYNYRKLVSIPLIDTSKGTDFSNMFAYCSSLTTIPLLDTSQGTYFYRMFYGCTSLTSIPLLNTSKGIDFGYYLDNDLPEPNIHREGMFENCTSLTTIPLLDTSKGTSFSFMFKGCTSLITIPLLDVSNGYNFYNMFYYCTSLTTVPMLNTSNGRNFERMFENCTSLTTVSLDINRNDSSYKDSISTLFNKCVSISEANIKGINEKITIPTEKILNKHSLIYTILNSRGSGPLHLRENNYALYYQDVDILAALMRSKCSIVT